MKKGKRKKVKALGRGKQARFKEGDGYFGSGLAQHSRVKGKGYADADEQKQK